MFFRKLTWDTAVLDVAIVVVGIFLGFQADNWYQARQDRQLEQEYMVRLLEDLQADLAETDGREATVQQRLDFVKLLEASIDDESVVRKDPTTYIKALSEGYYVTSFERNRFTFDELVSTGNLSLVDDNRLRQSMHEYYDSSGPGPGGRSEFRNQASDRFAGILTIDQMYLNLDRSELVFSIQDALDARSKFINKQQAVDMLGNMAEVQLTLLGRASRLRNEAGGLILLLQGQLE